MAPTTLTILRRRAVGLVQASLVLGGMLGAIAVGGGHAEARVPAGATGPEADSCRYYQNIYDILARDLAEARTVEEQRSLRRQIERVQNVWDYNCKALFGSLSRDVVMAPAVPGAMSMH
ncbi:MAG TPA: hypothetical protein VH951_13975 [Dehalococcoidia bacterium]